MGKRLPERHAGSGMIVSPLAVLPLAMLALGQLADPSGTPAVVPEAPLTMPTVPVEKPAPPPDRIKTTDGKVIEGRIVGEVPGGLEIEDGEGLRQAVPRRVIVELERGGRVTMVRPEAPRLEVDLEGVRRRLELTFDVVKLRRERDQLRYGDKVALLALGAATAAVGFSAFRGDAGSWIAALGAVEAGAGGVALGWTWQRRRWLEREIEARRESLRLLDGR